MTADTASSDNMHDGSGSDVLTDVLDKIGEIARAASSGSLVFRGEPKWYPEISSSLYREYKTLLEPFELDGFDIRSVQEEIIADAARHASDLARQDILSQLQHYGHPTNLIDFTTDYLIALFFACASEHTDDGRVILLSTETNFCFRMKSPANRIKAQKSVFVDPPSGVVDPDHMIRIDAKLKLPILKYLGSHHDVSTQTIYDDIHGFIKNANVHRSAYAEFHIGGLYLNQGILEEALKHYNRSIELNGYETASLVNRAATFARMGRNDEAIRDFSQVIAFDHRDARAYRDRGYLYLDIGQSELAEKDFSEAIRLDERMEDAYMGRARSRANRGDFDGALQDLNVAVDLNPKSSATYSGRGASLAAIGNYQPALVDLGTALELDPNNAAAYMARALLNFNIGEYQGALEDLAAYMAVGGDDPAAAQFSRGIALIALGKFEEARGELKAALGQDPVVANRVVNGLSDIVDGTETLRLQDEVPSDLLEMLKPQE
ncbi:MAG: tetratricopeptide repeat protein [Dehalococcoidia bacterium]|nr:tetratricopeptide repeat protein [Dehalococcoidia bacterium]